MSYVYFLIICTIWGASFILMNRAGLAFSPVAVGGWRVGGGALVLVAAILWRRLRPSVTVGELGGLAIVGLLAYAWPYAVQPYLVVRHDHGFIGMMVALVPLFTIGFSVPMLRTWPTVRQAVGVAGGLICMGVILMDGDRRGIPPLDLALAISVPMSYAFGNTLIKRHLTRVSPLVLTATALAVAAFALLPPAVFGDAWLGQFELGSPSPPRQWATAISCLVVLAVLGTGAAMLMFNYLIVHEGPLFAGMVTYIVPLGAVAWSWLDNGRVTSMQLAALGGVLAMVALVQYGAARPRAARRPDPCPRGPGLSTGNELTPDPSSPA